MSYSTKEITEKLNISKYTLRYYEKEGLLSKITRDKNGNREYSDLDLETLILIRSLKTLGISIKNIKEFVDMCFEGYSTLPSRKKIILIQKKVLESQMKEIHENLNVIDLKLKYYDELESNGPEKYHDTLNIIQSDLSTRMIKLLKQRNDL